MMKLNAELYYCGKSRSRWISSHIQKWESLVPLFQPLFSLVFIPSRIALIRSIPYQVLSSYVRAWRWGSWHSNPPRAHFQCIYPPRSRFILTALQEEWDVLGGIWIKISDWSTISNNTCGLMVMISRSQYCEYTPRFDLERRPEMAPGSIPGMCIGKALFLRSFWYLEQQVYLHLAHFNKHVSWSFWSMWLSMQLWDVTFCYVSCAQTTISDLGAEWAMLYRLWSATSHMIIPSSDLP